jgi:hypothetical protein
MFVVADYWDDTPSRTSPKTSRDMLFDIMIQAPGLLERADQIKTLLVTEGDRVCDKGYLTWCNIQNLQCFDVIEYLRDCDTLIRRLSGWLASLEESENGPLWWYSEKALVSLDGQKSSNPPGLVTSNNTGTSSRSSLISFCSPRIPALLLNYWSVLLELSIAILEVRNIFCHYPTFPTFAETLGTESPSLSIEMSMPTKLALRICQTTIHLSSTLEGCTVAYIPIKLAERYFIQLLSSYHGCSGSDPESLENYQRVQIGYECSRKAFEMLQDTVQHFM